MKIKSLKRESRQANTIEDQGKAQKELRDMERKQRRQRQQIFEAEDEILEKRDELIDALEHRLKQKTETTELFTVRWQVT